jgi:hypothetical protein
VSSGLNKFKKYYDLLDGQDAYCVAHVLDPRFRTLFLEKELGKVNATKVIKHIKALLHEQYPSSAQANSVVRRSPSKPAAKTIEARILQKLHSPRQQLSVIDSYFEDGAVTVQNTAIQDKEWLFWWRTHYHE